MRLEISFVRLILGSRLVAAASGLALFGSLLTPSGGAYAYDEAVLAAMESKVVSQFCMEREWLRCFREEPSNCEVVVKRFVRPCLMKTLQGQDAQGSQEAAHGLATSILDCFNTKFEEDHRFGKDPSPACKNAPAHLQ